MKYGNEIIKCHVVIVTLEFRYFSESHRSKCMFYAHFDSWSVCHNQGHASQSLGWFHADCMGKMSLAESNVVASCSLAAMCL